MFKYFIVLALAGVAVYTAQHPEILGLSFGGLSGPEFKVWVETSRIPPNNDPYYTLKVQSREEKPTVVNRIEMNDDPKCINMDVNPFKMGSVIKLGQVLRFPLGIPGFNACEVVKVIVSTDRGESVYNFK